MLLCRLSVYICALSSLPVLLLFVIICIVGSQNSIIATDFVALKDFPIFVILNIMNS